MRRGLILGGLWALGVAVALTLAFAAVGRVANGVAPHDVARLSSTEIDNELTGPAAATGPTSSEARPPTTTTTTTSVPTTTSTTSATTSTTRPTGSTVGPRASTSTTTSSSPPPTATTSTTGSPAEPHNTVTTAQGGTVFSRCSGSDKIVYVAAVPKSGYERTVDIEGEGGIQQVFVNGRRRSKIGAECSGGVVHAQVEEESTDE